MQGQEGVDFTLGNVDDLDPSEWQVPPYCIPIHANVMTYDWSTLISTTQFDVLMMDPPWQLATANPTRGMIQVNIQLYPSYNPVIIQLLLGIITDFLLSPAQPFKCRAGCQAKPAVSKAGLKSMRATGMRQSLVIVAAQPHGTSASSKHTDG